MTDASVGVICLTAKCASTENDNKNSAHRATIAEYTQCTETRTHTAAVLIAVCVCLYMSSGYPLTMYLFPAQRRPLCSTASL